MKINLNFNKKTIFVILVACLVAVILSIGRYFDVSQPPKQADIIVSLGGDNGLRIKKTLELYDANMSRSHKLILTGADDFDASMKIYELDWRADYLSKKGVKKGNIIFNTTAQNTLEEIFFIKKYLLAHHLHSVIFITDPPHSRRISYFASDIAHYEDANLSYIVVATNNDWWNREHYYTNPEAIIFVVNESIKLTYYFIQNLLGNLHVPKN